MRLFVCMYVCVFVERNAGKANSNISDNCIKIAELNSLYTSPLTVLSAHMSMCSVEL